MNENPTEASWISRVLMGGLVMLTVISVIGVLISPLFLPSLRDYYRTKYLGFKHQESLVQQEMASKTPLVWSACLIGWAVLLFMSFVAR